MGGVPPVSIGLPVYNGERYLAITLADLLGQTYGDFEVVLCDNASTDATADIAREAATRDARVRYVRNESNIGALPNANRAFDLARGAHYALAAHDDRHAPDFLARLVDALDQEPGGIVAYGDQTLVGEDGRPFAFDEARGVYVGANGAKCHYDAALQRRLPDDPVARYRAVLRTTDTNAPMHGLFRRDVLERIGRHHVHGSDRLILARAALLGRFAYVDAPLFGYRIHAGSTLHLTRRQWLARETGGTVEGDALDAVRSLRAYLDAVSRADLSASQRIRATAATLAFAVRPERLRRTLLPSPDNYWGWTRWPWVSEARHDSAERWRGQGQVAERWNWLMDGDTPRRSGTEESFRDNTA